MEKLFIIESRLAGYSSEWRQICAYVPQPLDVANADCGWLQSNITVFEYRVVAE